MRKIKFRCKDIAIIEKEGVYKGFKYMILGYDMGHRCGYVRIPKSHNLYLKDYDDLDFEVHGGLTFAGTPCFKRGFWIGFDCAHLCDKIDLNLIRKFNIEITDDMIERYNQSGERVRTTEYVEKECKHLIDQIKNYKEER